MKQPVLFFIPLVILLVGCATKEQPKVPISTFEIVEGFQIELMAMEPLIADPVDMEIDEQGRWYVVEMHGYPLDLSGSGKVKRLLDTNGDGIPDQSTIFADSLVFPTGIIRWKQGFLVTDPPNVYYLEDIDDDGRADIREIMLTGFARSNPQHNVNNPVYGIDNWIYLSHEGAIRSKNHDKLLGDRGSVVHYPKSPDVALPQNANGLFVKFKPDEKQLAMGSARGQFGHAFNPWGNHFLTSNASHLYHVVFDAKYMERNKDLQLAAGRTYIPKSGRGFEIFPITQDPQHQLLTDVGMMTSACGILWYKGGLFPSEYDKVVFTAEPTHNLIHADRVRSIGATFESEGLFEDHEFLASTDAWFRPVNHYVGPDGALYVIDYYRKIIEHPEWLSDEVIESGDLYEGVDQGRIYRISPSGTSKPDFIDKLNLGTQDTRELIGLLNHENSWYRTHAQRLLMDRKSEEVIAILTESIEKDLNQVAKVHAMYILDGKNGLSEDILMALLEDDVPEVRVNAIQLAEYRLHQSEIVTKRLLSMINDQNPKVRYQLLLTLGDSNTKEALDARNQLLMKDLSDEWVQWAALSSNSLDAISIFRQAQATLAQQETKAAAEFIGRVSKMIARNGDKTVINELLTQMLEQDEKPWYAAAVVEGLRSSPRSLELSPKNLGLLSSTFTHHADPALRTNSLKLLNHTGHLKQDSRLVNAALRILEREDSDAAFCSDAISILAMYDADKYHSQFISSVASKSDVVRRSCINAFNYVRDKSLQQNLIALWPQLTPDERRSGVRILLNNDEGKKLILNAIDRGDMLTTSLSWPNTVQLLNSRNELIRNEARRILQGNELDKDSIWSNYKEALAIQGNTSKGQLVFKQSCGTCHQKGGNNGIAYGPDLASVQNRNASSLLLEILLPNRSIADGYELWQIELVDGTGLSGIISDEGPSSLTIRDAAGLETVVKRTEVKSLQALEMSAMPENLQTQISIQEMADLLAYLKN